MKNVRYIVVACMILLMSSCQRDDMDGWGYFDLSLSADVGISEAVRSAEALPQAEYQDYTIMLYKEGILQWETSYAEFVTDPENRYRRVPAGEYTVYVENCTALEAEEGFGRPRYAGSGIFTVTAGRTAETAVICTMINAKLTLAYAPGLRARFNPWGLSVADANGRKLVMDVENMSESHETAQVAYCNVAENGEAELTYTLVATDKDEDMVMRYDVDFTVKAGMWNKVSMTTSEMTGQ